MAPFVPNPNNPGNYNALQQAAFAAQSVTAALQNPYGIYNGNSYAPSSHYAQAYAQAGPQSDQLRTNEGYTISPTYVPDHASPRGRGRGYQRGRGSSHIVSSAGPSRQNFHHPSSTSNWYEPGTVRCSRETCAFTGSKKSVEIHMMDRHFIFPPDWETRKHKNEWDADPSLKGKRIAVQGTDIYLDTPEAIDAWIAERKKRWPSAARVAEKKKNLQDAIDRGQIIPDDTTLLGNKRRKTDHNTSRPDRGRNARVREGRGGKQPGSKSRRNENRHQNQVESTKSHPLPPKPFASELRAQMPSYESNSDSGSDVDFEKDAVSAKNPSAQHEDGGFHEQKFNLPSGKDTKYDVALVESDKPEAEMHLVPIRRKHANQPKIGPPNIFGQRQSLLRNLLLPEIRVTVSNFSQALRFLVENDFLRNVELKPGDALSNRIEVIHGEEKTLDID